MTAVAVGPRPPYWVEGTPDKVCGECRASFFTNVGLAEHTKNGCENSLLGRVTRRWVTGRFSPEGLVVQQDRGRQIAALNNSRRRRCDECGRTTTCAGLGAHQKSTGHTGWTAV